MSTMLISWDGTHEFGCHLGDTISSIKVAWLWAQNYPCSKYLLTLAPSHDLNFLWQKFIDTFKVQVIYDTFHPGNADERFNTWNKWRLDRSVNGVKFDIYKELYRRIDGGHRQGLLCGGEKGLGRKNVFEYFYFGQEEAREPLIGGEHFDGPTLFYHPPVRPQRDVLVAPYAKCQGNAVFTFDYWTDVVHRLLDEGLTVTVNYNGKFCEDLNGHPLYRKEFSDMRGLQDRVCRHKVVTCGNTGVGWMAAACGVPLLAMQPVDSHIQDYRYEWCGVKSLIEFLETPDAAYCVKRLVEECDRMMVFTSGKYDGLTAANVKHLEESKSLGNRLVVGLHDGHNREERTSVLMACKYVDEVIVISNEHKAIEAIHPNVVTIDSDHSIPPDSKAFVESYGGRVVVTGGERAVDGEKVIRKLQTSTEVMKAIRDAAHLSPNPVHKLKLMADQFLTVADLPGAVADVGCYRGACSLILKRIAPDKTIHLFDTFAGNPLEDPLCHHKKGEWAADLKEVKKTVGEDERTFFHPGFFPTTALKADEMRDLGRFCFVFVDVDTYQSTQAAIEFFWPRLAPGGKLFFDDWDWEPCRGITKAVGEAFPEEVRTVFAEHHGCVVTKTE